jgi:hypothetical protein
LQTDTIFVDVWYDENRNEPSVFAERDWFLREIYYPKIESFLKAFGKKVVLNTHCFKNKHDVKRLGNDEVKEFAKFRAPDILFIVNGQPIITIETTNAVPTGNRPEEKYPIMFVSTELKIPSIIYLPLIRVRPPPHYSNAFCNPRICLLALYLTRKTEVPTHVVFSEEYTEYLKEKLSPDDESIIRKLVKSRVFLQDYIIERLKLFFEGNPLKMTRLDHELINISEEFLKWREKYFRKRRIISDNKIIFRHDPDRSWSERGTGCLGAIDVVIQTKIEKGYVEVWFPNLGKNFWYFIERKGGARMRIIKRFADVIKYQDDLSERDLRSIEEVLKGYHRGERNRRPLYLGENVPSRLQHSIVVFSNVEDWLEGIPEEIKNLPEGSKVILPRLTRNFCLFKKLGWDNFVKSKKFKEILYQDDLSRLEFKVLEKHFK